MYTETLFFPEIVHKVTDIKHTNFCTHIFTYPCLAWPIILNSLIQQPLFPPFSPSKPKQPKIQKKKTK